MRLPEDRDQLVKNLIRGGEKPESAEKTADLIVAAEHKRNYEVIPPRGLTYYRCKRCGKVEAPYQIEPGDDELPRADCPCYMGPDWVRGVFTPDRPSSVCSEPGCSAAREEGYTVCERHVSLIALQASADRRSASQEMK